jgi:phospholipid/cholesterol/gamma-HCH transport system substrate-binding protein
VLIIRPVKFSNEAKLGAFVLAVASAFAFLILTFGEIPVFKPNTKVYVVYFPDVAGLSVGAEVRVAGIKSGKVKSVSLEEGKVKVVFEVDKSIAIYKDASAGIGTLGLMGDKYLAIYPGSHQAGLLKEGGVITQTTGFTDTDKMIKDIADAAQAVKTLTENFRFILEENRQDLRQLVINLETLTRNLNQVVLENRENLRGALYTP